MIHFIKTYLWLLLPFLLLSNLKTNQESFKTISHEVVINHPGEKESIKMILNEVQNEEGLPIEYTMEVYSVICLEDVCKIIPVKLYWNNIGVYQNYELAKGETLEKYEADLFSPEDYIKLQIILSDTNSPFKEVYIDEILTVPDEHGDEDLDAVSGATALELDEKDTVPGAALTCYTLWHWANGEIVQKIKEITGKSVSDKQLQDFLVNENQVYFGIALKDLERRKVYEKRFISIITKRVLEEEILLKSVFNYLKKAPSDIYFSATKEVFIKGETAQQLAAIQSLKSINKKVPNSYLDNLSNELPNLSSYQAVSFFLDLMHAKNSNSKTVSENVFLLLKADFIKSRRAYWFLKNEKLSSKQKRVLKSFQKKNKSSL